MHTDPLVKMANQIAAFFDAMPDRAEALEGVALHIRKFWVPRMRQRFLAYSLEFQEVLIGTPTSAGPTRTSR